MDLGSEHVLVTPSAFDQVFDVSDTAAIAKMLLGMIVSTVMSDGHKRQTSVPTSLRDPSAFVSHLKIFFFRGRL